MIAFRNLFAAALALALFAVPLAAQKGSRPSLSVQPDILQAGGSTVIVYQNPSLAGQTVVIEVDNGMRDGTETQAIKVQLDANGVGKVRWIVPEWWGANFNAPDVAEVHAPILR